MTPKKAEHAALLMHCLLQVQKALDSAEQAAAFAEKAQDWNLASIIKSRMGDIDAVRKVVEEAFREACDE